MKKLNNKGFAASTLLYVLVIMMFLIVLALMSTMGTNRKNTKNLSQVIDDELNRYGRANQNFSYDSSIDIEPRNILIIKDGWYSIELWGPGSATKGGGYMSGLIYLDKDDVLYVHLTPETGVLESSYITWNKDDKEHIIMKTPGYGEMPVEYLISGSGGYEASDTIKAARKFFFFTKITPEENHSKSRFKISIVGEGKEKPFKRGSSQSWDQISVIKDCATGSNLGNWVAWTEIQAYEDGKNVALGKPATISGCNTPPNGNIHAVTDGKIYPASANDYYSCTNTEDPDISKCITIDLYHPYNLDQIIVWHYYEKGRLRSYKNNIISTGSTPNYLPRLSQTDNTTENEFGMRYGNSAWVP